MREAYGTSIQYSLRALTSWVTELNDPNLVLMFLGDHQPAASRHEPGRSHAVPIAIVARDPAVFKAHCLLALAGRPATQAAPLRSSPWTPSATSSSAPSARRAAQTASAH